MSNLINKVKEAVSSDKSSHGTTTHGTHTTTGAGEPVTGTHTTTTGTGAPVGTTGGTHTGVPVGAAGTSGPATRTDGPHSSNVLNKADPRVDSDRDYSRNMGANPHGTASTGTHTTTTGGGIPPTGTHAGAHTGAPIGTTGGTHTGAPIGTTGGTHTGAPIGTTGTHAPVGSTGNTAHSSHMANVADPRVNTSHQHQTAPLGSTTGHSTTTGHHTSTTGAPVGSSGLGTSTGPAPNTAGPHKSDALNKADPRVDSNLDGSKTVGGDKTFSQTGASSGLAHKDPTDATQVPPSVLQKHVGGPAVHHDDATHEREKRHSVSHQEQHRGL